MKPVFGGFETRLKFIIFGLWFCNLFLKYTFDNTGQLSDPLMSITSLFGCELVKERSHKSKSDVLSQQGNIQIGPKLD